MSRAMIHGASMRARSSRRPGQPRRRVEPGMSRLLLRHRRRDRGPGFLLPERTSPVSTKTPLRLPSTRHHRPASARAARPRPGRASDALRRQTGRRPMLVLGRPPLPRAAFRWRERALPSMSARDRPRSPLARSSTQASLDPPSFVILTTFSPAPTRPTLPASSQGTAAEED